MTGLAARCAVCEAESVYMLRRADAEPLPLCEAHRAHFASRLARFDSGQRPDACCICGTLPCVRIQQPHAVELRYCSRHWLDLDDLPAGAVVTWVYDTAGTGWLGPAPISQAP